MPNSIKSSDLTRKQLDKRFGNKFLRQVSIPGKGWIKTIREALGLNQSQLARRVGMAPPSLSRIENSEVDGNLEIKTLRNIANALGCDFKYVFVPHTSLDEFLHSQAKLAAKKIVSEIEKQMQLEGQGTSRKFQRQKIENMTEELLRNLDKRIWNVDDEKN